MKYYSTGIGSHLPKRGAPVECTNANTVKILLERGFLVESLDSLEAEKVEVEEVKPPIVEEVKPPIVEEVKPPVDWKKYPIGWVVIDGMSYTDMKTKVARLGLKTNGVTFPALKKALNDYNKSL